MNINVIDAGIVSNRSYSHLMTYVGLSVSPVETGISLGSFLHFLVSHQEVVWT